MRGCMLPLKNDRFLKAIRREPVDVTPIWIMRQAGRYLPEYQATRARAGSFMTLCKTPELACEVTLQPLARFPLDAAIIFSDILTIPDAMGLGLSFIEGKGPQFARPLQRKKDIMEASLPDLNDLRYVYDAISLTQKELAGKVPLIGFCGSPWTIAAYIVDGQAKTGFPLLLALKDEDPKALHHLLSVLAEAVTLHLEAQIVAGVHAVQLFDTWGGMLETKDYQTFSLAYMQQIVAAIKQKYPAVPVILFTKGGSQWLEAMADTGCDMIGVDWTISLAKARARVGAQVALQGNLAPESLLKAGDHLRAEVQTILEAYGKGSGHVFNLGHGITPDVPPEHVKILVDSVHELSLAYHLK